jgi:hypothetical protein
LPFGVENQTTIIDFFGQVGHRLGAGRNIDGSTPLADTGTTPAEENTDPDL